MPWNKAYLIFDKGGKNHGLKDYLVNHVGTTD